jgi:hypothetical protein
MTTFPILASKLVIVLLPFIVFPAQGFLRWRKHYGPEYGVLAYYLRYVRGMMATEDPVHIKASKIVLCLAWFVLTTSLLFI